MLSRNGKAFIVVHVPYTGELSYLRPGLNQLYSLRYEHISKVEGFNPPICPMIGSCQTHIPMFDGWTGSQLEPGLSLA